MTILAFDTATSATVVGVQRPDDASFEVRHDPQPGERPGHGAQLLGLVRAVLSQAGVPIEDVRRVGVGTGPGSFTGLRIGVASARALAQGLAAELVAIPTLRALAEEASGRAQGAAVLAVLDAGRGEAFAAAWRGQRALLAPVVVAADRLGEAVAGLGQPALAVGEGALRFRAQIEPAGAAIPPDDDTVHRLRGRSLCRLAAGAQPVSREAVVPEYIRPPDAERSRRQPFSWQPPTP